MKTEIQPLNNNKFCRGLCGIKTVQVLLTININIMKNQKLKDLSKKITENQVTSLSIDAIKTISGGTTPALEGASCSGTNDCWSFSAGACDKANDCWGYS